MAEGAIEGEAAMYEVPAAYATEFAFSRFEAAPREDSQQLLLPAGEATSLDPTQAGAFAQRDRRLAEWNRAAPCPPPYPPGDAPRPPPPSPLPLPPP